LEPSFATVFLSEKKKWGWGWDSSCQDPPTSDHAGTTLPSSGKEVLLERKDIGIVTKFLKGMWEYWLACFADNYCLLCLYVFGRKLCLNSWLCRRSFKFWACFDDARFF